MVFMEHVGLNNHFIKEIHMWHSLLNTTLSSCLSVGGIALRHHELQTLHGKAPREHLRP